jgi:D-arabinose 1-dehydrogenase-like Zn-dependent alcohol dehydrogenase
MQRARLMESGWQRDLVYEDAAPSLPPPQGKLVRVAVEACGVCHRDLIDRSGRYPYMQLPITPGHEVAGRVVAVGAEVTRFAVGDRVGTLHRDGCGQCAACAAGETSLCPTASWVLGILADGGYASELLAPESCLFALPEELPAAEAAVYQCTFGTAWRGLRGVTAGQRVLITGANGGVGAAAVQLATRLGAEVVAIVREARHRDAVAALGAHEVVVDADGGFYKAVHGIDLALECVGQPTFNASLRTLRIGGRIVIIGNVVAERAALNLGYVIVNALHIVGSSGATAADMAALLALAPAKPLHMPIVDQVGLDRADEAQRRVKAGGLLGRIVLRP